MLVLPKHNGIKNTIEMWCSDAEYVRIIQGYRDKEGTPQLCIGDIIKFHQPGMVLDKQWL